MCMDSSRFDHGGNIYAPRSEDAPPWLDFSANINPLGLAASVRKAIADNIDAVIHYPDPMARELKASLADHYGVPEESIILGNGAAEIFYLFFAVKRFKRVLIPAPTFSEYERAARAAHTDVNYFMLKATENFALDAERFCAQARQQQADVVCLANPNNPTGNLIPPSQWQIWVTGLQDTGQWIMLDESFLDFLPDAESYSLLRQAATQERLLVVRSLTKFFALPGLRLGFAVAPPSLVREINAAKDVWNVNVLAQKAGVAALADTAYQEESRRLVAVEKEFLSVELAKLPGWKIFSPAANFILADVSNTGQSGLSWAQALRRQGILIRTFTDYPGLTENYIRLAVRSRAENETLLAALDYIRA